jgi:hypothetical protein
VPQNIFKIFDGRTNFWQWDTKQKLIVLDESITQIHFSNRNMTHAILRDVYMKDGLRVCDVPDDLLKLPRNLVAYAYSDGYTKKSVKFAVVQRPMPSDYISDPSEEINKIEQRLELLEITLKDIELGNQELQKFENQTDASQWAQEHQKSGVIVVIHIDGKWIAHMVEDDYSVTPICNCNGEMVIVDVYDGGDADGHEDATEVEIWDGGSAAGI